MTLLDYILFTLKMPMARSNVDSDRDGTHNRKRPIPDHDSLSVIGVGLPRTGTASLKAALELLGFGPCHHMYELFDHPEQTVQFLRAYNGEYVDFRALLKGYRSAVDVPSIDFYKEIHRAYPAAKLVLTVRDSGDKWFESFSNTIRPVFANNGHYLTIYLIRYLRLQCTICRTIWKRWTLQYGQIGPSVHDQYNARLLSENPKGSVLVFNVKDGWSPLCEFLGVAVPLDVPFPNINDTKYCQGFIRKGKMKGALAWLAVSVPPMIVGIYLLKAFIM